MSTNFMDRIEREFRFIQSYHIFTKEELLRFRKTRIEYERQLHESPQIPSHILSDYIDHLISYIQIIQKRMKEWRATDHLESFVSDILQRTKVLMELRLTYYGEQDQSFFSKYLQFCSAFDQIEEVGLFLSKEYPNDVKIWIITANFFIKDHRNSKSAVDLLLTALNNNPGTELLYKEIFRIELDAAARSARKIYLDKCTRRLMDLLKKLLEEEHSVEYFLEILDLILQYTFTQSLQQFYVEQIILKFPNSPDVWHRLAQNEMLDNDVRIAGKFDTHISTHIEPNKKFLACIQKYKEGLNSVSDPAKSKLWFLYIDFLIKIKLNSGNKFDKDLKYRMLKTALTDGCNYITEDQFVSWLKFLNLEDSIELIELGLRVLPTSPKLWRARMHFESLDGNQDALIKMFQEGRLALQENSFPLWEYFITFHILFFNAHDNIEAIYEEGIREHPNISNELKPRYIEWLAMTKGIDAARDLYTKIADVQPYCKQLHFKMLDLEKFQSNCDFEFMESINLLATRHFKDHLDIWFRYIKFKVSYFYFKYRDEPVHEHLLELKQLLKDVCKIAKTSLPVNSYAELKLHCLEILQC